MDAIRSRILTVRGVQVMLDRDLAELYGVPTKRLNEQVKRNMIRFPSNFMFTLSDEEVKEAFIGGNDVGNRSRSQIATLNKGRGHNIKYRPYFRRLTNPTFPTSSPKYDFRTDLTFGRREDREAVDHQPSSISCSPYGIIAPHEEKLKS